MTILRVPLHVRTSGLYKLQIHAEGAGQAVDRTATIRFVATKPRSPIWQDGAIRVAVIRGAGRLDSLGRLLGKSFVVQHVADASLYDAVDTRYRTAAAVVVVDLSTVPAYTLAELHALLPEVQIIGIGGHGASFMTVLPRGASAAQIAHAVRRAIR